VFCGINPGFRSAAAAAHFANPRNDFWRLLADAGLTPRLLAPDEQLQMLELGYGLTNAAYRTTKGSSDLRRGDFAGSADRFERLARELAPELIAFAGKVATRESSASGLSMACGNGASPTRVSSSSLRPRPRTPLCRTRNACVGFARSAPSSGSRNGSDKGVHWTDVLFLPQRRMR
jgi:hypothetical protein